MTLTKSSCPQRRHEILLPLETPKIPDLLETQGGKGTIAILPGEVPLQVHTGHVLFYIVVTGTHRNLQEMQTKNIIHSEEYDEDHARNKAV